MRLECSINVAAISEQEGGEQWVDSAAVKNTMLLVEPHSVDCT